jgi:polysaccharide chain length determinant protein (PEP-CTERM system associated)
VLPAKTFKPEDIVGILLRRRWLILLPFGIGLALVPLIAERVPKVYRSEALIMVVPQRVPDTYVRSTVTERVEDRLPSINDQILSRSRLERVINEFDLYKELRATQPMEDVVRRMRSDIGSPEIEEGQQSFHVSYVNTDALVAQKVTARLASLFIEENSSDRENLAENTNVFIESQLAEARQRLLVYEQKLEVFRRTHAGELPSQLEGNLRAITSAQVMLQSIGESINRARERRLLVERQLVDARTLPPVAVAVPGQGAQPDSIQSSPLSQQLAAAKARLAAALLRYKPGHPEVRGIERQIRDLQARVDEEAKRTPEETLAQGLSREERDRLRRIGELEAELEVIDHQVKSNQAQQAELQAKIADYQRKVEAVPARESELVELTRDYDILKRNYEELVTKRENSKLAANLERRQIGEQFRIVDSASLPERPTNEVKRLGMIFSGAALGFLVGLALTGFLEYRNSSFAREEDVLGALGLPVLAAIPAMKSAEERRGERRRNWALDVVGATVLLASVIVVAVWGSSL